VELYGRVDVPIQPAVVVVVVIVVVVVCVVPVWVLSLLFNIISSSPACLFKKIYQLSTRNDFMK